jgi:hypothetical protein
MTAGASCGTDLPWSQYTPKWCTDAASEIDEFREVRERISARFDNDPVRLVAHYIELQAQHAERLIDPPKAAKLTDEPAASSVGRSLTG